MLYARTFSAVMLINERMDHLALIIFIKNLGVEERLCALMSFLVF